MTDHSNEETISDPPRSAEELLRNALIVARQWMPSPFQCVTVEAAKEVTLVDDVLQKTAGPNRPGDEVTPQAEADERRLWIWRIGPHEYVAYDNPYPCVSVHGDPLTFGEPHAICILKHSVNGRPEKSIEAAFIGMKRCPDIWEQSKSREVDAQKLVEALKFCKMVIGHPDDACMKIVDEALASWEKGRKQNG